MDYLNTSKMGTIIMTWLDRSLLGTNLSALISSTLTFLSCSSHMYTFNISAALELIIIGTSM